jgi:catalase (peroxidase I)
VRTDNDDHALFDTDFADAWFKLIHRSAAHPKDEDLEKDAGKCTAFESVSGAKADL